ncbi:DNA helicase/exodeoxyribonuclease V gamma subunit [Plasticicumulans lactativorans]|uniref:RecBCD enzyme subunit RecC n=1 Tax=Plasticicumulans lactativorans TaxID=1133106 RepID=A0A4R2LJZ8_9GAMM|nr:exodeoxyribonuclease V subunit gamma [Plasticicumulans lactativorans]TCO79705.1 DNA helicase/exodeoxyribonuclease V gamma subunit [Plasticicumulans lactativorans]
MLSVHHSNRMEVLATRLAARLAEPAAEFWAPEVIVVQSNGMRRWLGLRLADALGVAANLSFPLPAKLFWELYRAVLPAVPADSAWDAPVLAWRVLAACEALPDDAALAPLRAYLDASDARGRCELAARIADAFDQYLVHRPDWVARWEAGAPAVAGDGWQAALWRLLAAHDADHRARLHAAFVERLRALAAPPPGLPARLSFIGIPTLPAPLLDALHALARLCDIDLYLLNPCREYWGLIESERRIARELPAADHAALYLETGNRLLASLGRQGRDFHHLLAELPVDHETTAFVDPGEGCLLHALQRDILDLRNRGGNQRAGAEADAAAPRHALAASDRSVQIHVCHGPAREVEVLHDQLLDLFAREPTLGPADVLVMAPDIEVYAPLVQAVFGSAERERRIPFSLADRGLTRASALVETFLALTALPGGRWSAAAVAGLLETPALRRRFGLGEDDLGRVRDWLAATGVRWGIDAAGRAALGLPDSREHTWRDGLDRLLLGYALPTGGRALWADVLPHDEVEGGEALAAGRFNAFAERLFALERELAGERSPQAWAAVLARVLGDCFAADADEEAELQPLREALQALADSATRAGFSGAVPLAAVRARLAGELDAAGTAGFLAGGVTFCAMVPMRAIPFRVVCLLGLDDAVFPRRHRAPDFDLIAQHPRRGDRSRRNDDRYLFLEALLSAREVLYLSHVGQDIRDNAEIPPSVLLAELGDYIREGAQAAHEPGGDALAAIRVRHPLQPFSPRYFGADPRLPSYSTRLCEAAREVGLGRGVPPPLVSAALPAPPEALRALSPAELVRGLGHPARLLLRERLGVHLERGEGVPEEREPFVLDDFADRELRRRLLDWRRAGTAPGSVRRLATRSGVLPHGAVGEQLYAREAAKVDAVLARAAGAPAALAPLPVAFEHAGYRLDGWLRDVYADGLRRLDPNPVSARSLFELWLQHLLLNLLVARGEADVEPASRLDALGGSLVLAPVADAAATLGELLALYGRALCEPLPFVPACAWAYAQATGAGTADDAKALAAARGKWEGGFGRYGYREDPYYAALFGERSPVDAPDFARLALAVYGPLRAALQAAP